MSLEHGKYILLLHLRPGHHRPWTGCLISRQSDRGGPSSPSSLTCLDVGFFLKFYCWGCLLLSQDWVKNYQNMAVVWGNRKNIYSKQALCAKKCKQPAPVSRWTKHGVCIKWHISQLFIKKGGNPVTCPDIYEPFKMLSERSHKERYRMVLLK